MKLLRKREKIEKCSLCTCHYIVFSFNKSNCNENSIIGFDKKKCVIKDKITDSLLEVLEVLESKGIRKKEARGHLRFPPSA